MASFASRASVAGASGLRGPQFAEPCLGRRQFAVVDQPLDEQANEPMGRVRSGDERHHLVAAFRPAAGLLPELGELQPLVRRERLRPPECLEQRDRLTPACGLGPAREQRHLQGDVVGAQLAVGALVALEDRERLLERLVASRLGRELRQRPTGPEFRRLGGRRILLRCDDVAQHVTGRIEPTAADQERRQSTGGRGIGRDGRHRVPVTLLGVVEPAEHLVALRLDELPVGFREGCGRPFERLLRQLPLPGRKLVGEREPSRFPRVRVPVRRPDRAPPRRDRSCRSG